MGRVIMSGIVPTLKAPVTGIQAGTLAVGSVVKLMEGGAAVEYLVVNQGIPSNSSLYDASCDGTWLLRKDCLRGREWNSSGSNAYASSYINTTWLNGTIFNTLGSAEQATIKQVKIPYCVGGGSSTIRSGPNGLSVKLFLLGGCELGDTSGGLPADGAKLNYFETGTGSSALNKRIATRDGSAVNWWLRSPNTNAATNAWLVSINGTYSSRKVSDARSVRPALVLPGNALFDETTMLLKGVK